MPRLERGERANINGFPINIGGVIKPNDEYSFDLITFPIGGENGDGAIFNIEPGGSTRVVRVIGDYQVFDAATKGQGWFLVQRGDTGKVEACPANPKIDEIHTYSTGDTIVWIAGEDGLEVANIFTPPFPEEFSDAEEIIEIDDPSLTPEFRRKYNELKGSKS